MSSSLFDQLRELPPTTELALESGATHLGLSELQSRSQSLAQTHNQLGA